MPTNTQRHIIGLALVAGALLFAPFATAQTVVKEVESAAYFQRSLWTIEKTADTSEVTLSCDQTFDVEYEVTVHKVARTGEQFPEGTITVTNTTGGPLTLNGVADIAQSSGDPGVAIPLEVECSGIVFPYVMAAGEVVDCTFEGHIMEPTELQTVDLNEARASFAGGGVVSSGLIPYSTQFVGQTDLCVDVSDDLQGPLGLVCFPETDHTFTYTRPVGPFGASGVYNVVNTASFFGTDSGPGGAPDAPGLPGSATGEASWTVVATVACEGGGCSLTQGYWKTHSSYGPAAHPNPTWLDLPGGLGPDTPFFGTGKTWYQLFHTPPAQGNAYISLAHQYMAARLNLLAGAPDILGTQIAQAETFFTNNLACYNNPRSCANATRNAMTALAGVFASYNEGTMPGTEHCDGELTGGANALVGDGSTFALATPAPNPTSGSASIMFDVPEYAQVALTAYDVMGREVARIADDFYEAGTHQVLFDGGDLPAGTYFIRMTSGDFYDVTRVVIAR